ncbi:M24 family metallopeptidase [Georgenia subflava]|uniref:M24 family metallopeptidase n=3 Tax=Georgenia subflava TaxID=1622177 RepID=A0A6N7ENM2_9MICO|nr:M24 family metallopeptidase [Georgenia subflava]
MAQRSLAALVVADPASINYLSGYNAWSFYTPQCLVVPAAGSPVLFARAMDAAGATFTTWLGTDDVEGYPEELVHNETTHPYLWIAGRLRERGLVTDGDVVAADLDAHFFSARGYLALAAGLPGVRIEDSRALVNWVRLVKSPYELDQLRIAGTIAQRAMEVALAAVRPGRRQCDVVADIMAAQAVGTPEHGGDYPSIVPMLPTGRRAGTPHLTWSDERLRAGEATTVELAGAYRRYNVPLARTVIPGRPDRRLAHTALVVRDAMAQLLAAMVPGRTAHEVHAVGQAVLADAGLVKESRMGYSIGLGYPPDWGEHTVSLRPGEQVALQAGMCFHVILGMWMDGWGYELSEPVVVTAGGVERLTRLTQNLTIIR